MNTWYCTKDPRAGAESADALPPITTCTDARLTTASAADPADGAQRLVTSQDSDQAVEAARLLAQREAWLEAVLRHESPDSPRVLTILPREELSAHTARVLAAAMCWNQDGFDIADVALVVGELTTNAVQHAVPPHGAPDTITVAIITTDTELKVGVGDLAPHLPNKCRAAAGAEHGRGMALINALSDRQYVETFDGGKVVWVCWDLNR